MEWEWSMFFSAYLGDEAGEAAWRATTNDHARWLGLPATLRSGCLRTGMHFAVVWIASAETHPADGLEETTNYAVFNTRGVPFPPAHSAPATRDTNAMVQQRLRSLTGNAVTLGVSLDSGRLTAMVPLTTPEQLYITDVRGSLVLANDQRLMLRWAGLELDERGICSLLQLGAVVPPLTVSRRVKRIPNGYTLGIEIGTGRQALQRSGCDGESASAVKGVHDPGGAVIATLDSILGEAPRGSILYFSGGVDSALLASRLPAIARTDIRLVNYSFGPEDAESAHALRMAHALQLPCERVTYDARELPLVLDRLGRDYSYPFADYSAIPTNLLMHATLSSPLSQPGAVEGTGADGAFGLGAKYGSWRRFYRLPGVVRAAMSTAYARLGLWRDNGRVGRVGRIARRSGLPLHVAAVIAQNALDGIAYRIPTKTHEEISVDVEKYLYGPSSGLAPEERLSLLDLVHVCAGEMAAKSFDLLRHNGTQPIYPFLDQRMVRLSTSLTWEQKCTGGETKGLLKQLLAQRVPKELVYRPKSGFVPPFESMLASANMQAYLHDAVLSPANPVTQVLYRNVVRRMIERAGKGRPLNLEAYFFLWGVTFLSGWLRQIGI